MAVYVVESRTKSGQYLATLPFRDFQGEFYYSKTREIRFSMSRASLNELTTNDIYPAKTEIVVWRDGVKIFCGPLWDIAISSQENKATLMAQDLSSYFERRAVYGDQKLSGTLGNIAWSLINTSQGMTNGALSITRGSTTGTNGPSVSGYKIKNGTYLNTALEELSDGQNGFDWQFTPDRVYNQYYPRLNTRARVRLEYGGNIRSYSDAIQGKYIGNSMRTIGKDSLMSGIVLDSNSMTEFGRMDYVDEQTGLSNINLLNEHNARSLARRRVPWHAPSIVLNSSEIDPFAGDIDYGQITTVIINDGYTQYNQDMLCKGFQVYYNKSGSETFTLYMQEIEV